MVSAPTQAIEMVLELHDAVHTSYISELLLGISFCDNKLSTKHSLKSTTVGCMVNMCATITLTYALS